MLAPAVVIVSPLLICLSEKPPANAAGDRICRGGYRMTFHIPACVSVLIVCCVICDPTGLLQPYTTTTERLRLANALQSARLPENHTVACVPNVPSASTTAASAVLIVLPLADLFVRETPGKRCRG